MKNPDYTPLKIVRTRSLREVPFPGTAQYVSALSNLAIAESNLVRAGKGSALPHFIAIVKEIELISVTPNTRAHTRNLQFAVRI